MKIPYISILILFLLTALISWKTEDFTNNWSEITPIADVMVALGEKKPHHYRDIKDSDQIKKGFELVTKGRTTGPDGKKSKLISSHFMCTDCHNITREDPDLNISDPEKRMEYAIQNNIPFLQGTTFWGIVNRRSWYNEDYIKKYGNLVLPTNDTLINAIQLCCEVCSQGRRAENWEIEAILAYFYSIQITLGDLNLSSSEFQKLNSTKGESKENISLLRSKYLTYSPATFLDPLYGDKRKYGKDGNPEKGKEIYDRSCMHCHHGGGVTNMTLDKNKLDYNFLRKHINSDGKKSIYNITRKGTYSKPAYKPYMPLYTEERMSHQQLEDLAAFLMNSK